MPKQGQAHRLQHAYQSLSSTCRPRRHRRRRPQWFKQFRKSAKTATWVSLVPLISTILTVSTTVFLNFVQIDTQTHQHELTAIQQVIREQLQVSSQINHVIMDWRLLSQLSLGRCHDGHYAGSLKHYTKSRERIESKLINAQYLAANVFNTAVQSKIADLLAMANDQQPVCLGRVGQKWAMIQTQINRLMLGAIDQNRHQLQRLL